MLVFPVFFIVPKWSAAPRAGSAVAGQQLIVGRKAGIEDVRNFLTSIAATQVVLVDAKLNVFWSSWFFVHLVSVVIRGTS